MTTAAAALFASAALADPPSAAQVSVPSQASGHHGQKMQAMFETPQEFMMFRADMHQATRGMDKAQKHSYRKAQIQKLRAMSGQQRQAFLQDLEARWNALPDAQKARIERHIENQQAKYQNRMQGGQAGYGQGSQQGDQGYGDQGYSQTPPPPPH
ncbi:MAG: hypothetical protein JOZ13_06640 [Alphaproteobacteria bacterium]|nr:hypothetical protein [Alphaproteobacteria bacterium]